MNDFPFAQTERAKALCSRITEAIVLLGRKSDSEAKQMIAAYWHDLPNIEDDPFLYSELPYYYAMCILHHPMIGDNCPEWYKDSNLWPPSLAENRRLPPTIDVG